MSSGARREAPHLRRESRRPRCGPAPSRWPADARGAPAAPAMCRSRRRSSDTSAARRPSGPALPPTAPTRRAARHPPARVRLRLQPPDRRRAGSASAVAQVRAQRQEDARHQRFRASSTAGVPTSPSMGGVSFRTRTRTSSSGELAQQHLRDHPGQPLEQVHARPGCRSPRCAGDHAVVHRAGRSSETAAGSRSTDSSTSTENQAPTACSALLTPWWP